jgi:hypothetical protein
VSATLVNDVSTWVAEPVSGNNAVSTIGMDFTNMAALSSTTQNLLATLTINQSNITTPVDLYLLRLTTASASTTPSDVNLNNVNMTINLSGPTGFIIPVTQGSNTYKAGAGTSTLVFSDAYAHYTLNANSSTTTIFNKITGATDTETGFARLQFADFGLAYDLNADAGEVAKILGAVFGASTVSNRTDVGLGLKLLNLGYSDNQLIDLALTQALGAGYSNTQEVNLLYANLTHTLASTSTINNFVNLINNGSFTPIQLAQFACDNALNLANINLTGLQQSGLAYIPQN